MDQAGTIAALPTAPIDMTGDVIEEWDGVRAEKRERVVRIVEYSPYPRTFRDQRRQVGFTRDESTSGMCILVDERQRSDEILRIAVRSVDGQSSLDALARVAWCEGRSDGRYWVGLELMERGVRRMRKVRHTRLAQEAS
jgi:hypothetical protein